MYGNTKEAADEKDCLESSGQIPQGVLSSPVPVPHPRSHTAEAQHICTQQAVNAGARTSLQNKTVRANQAAGGLVSYGLPMQIQVWIKISATYVRFPTDPFHLTSDPVKTSALLFQYRRQIRKTLESWKSFCFKNIMWQKFPHVRHCYKNILLLHHLRIYHPQFHWFLLSTDIRNSNQQGHKSFQYILLKTHCSYPGCQTTEASGFPPRFAGFPTMGKAGRQAGL